MQLSMDLDGGWAWCHGLPSIEPFVGGPTGQSSFNRPLPRRGSLSSPSLRAPRSEAQVICLDFAHTLS